MPHLPADLDGRRESFNSALVEFAKKLPETVPGIQTRQYIETNFYDVFVELTSDKGMSKSCPKSMSASIRHLTDSSNCH